MAVCWPLNWLLPQGVRPASFLFFPLWLGYILVVDAWVERRVGSSLWTRSPRQFVLTFLASAPAWWLFEVINWRTRNWEYLGREFYSGPEYVLRASLSFSTVMPAVFETAELVRSFAWVERLRRGLRLEPTRRMLTVMLAGGFAMLALTLWQPRYFYPFVWGSVFLILEPVNALLGRRTFFDWLREADWRPVLSLSLGALLCGFFWEMWNFYSYPKWIYHTPGVEFLYVFEMPLLGFIGYLPFAWELYALRNFLWPAAPALRL